MMAALAGPKRAPELVLFEATVLVAFVVFFVAWCGQLTALEPDASSGWIIAAGILSASVIADLGSGLVHWFADTWGSQDWPIVGRVLFAPFREHHADPKAITRHGFCETNGASAAVALPILGIAWLVLPDGEDLVQLYGSVVLAATAALGVLTNSIHKWAHADRVPRIVAWMQRSGLILSPQMHALHHVAPFVTHYCITHGWLNPILAKIRLYRVLEWLVSRCTGLVPRQEDLTLSDRRADA